MHENRLDSNTLGAGMQPAVKKSPALAVGGLLLGGALMLVGSLLTWFELEAYGDSLALRGTDMTLGNGTLGIGLLVMGFALPLGARASETGGRGWSIAALILAVSVLPFSTGAAFAPEATAPVAASEALSEEYDVSRSDAQTVLERAIDAGVVSVSPGPGSYVATFGALLALVAAIYAIARAKKFRGEIISSEMPPPPPLSEPAPPGPS